MKTCIVGLGAVGGLVAARLALAGHPVNALARGATLEAVRRDGLALQDRDGERERRRVAPIHASDSAQALGPQDLLILAVKTTALPSVASTIGPLIGPSTTILSAMNGVPWWFFHGLGERWRDTRLAACDADGALARAMPARQVLGCVGHLSSAMPRPGVVAHMAGSRLIVGEPGGGDSARLSATAELLRSGGFEVEVSPHVELDVWLKLWGNMTVNPISALTGATGDRILADDFVREFMSSAMREAAAIGEAIGLPVAMSPEERHAITRKLGAFRTSMLNDVEARRPIELDALVGAVLEMGRLTGVATPTIDALFGLTRLFGRVHGLYPQA
jgi:2-dehydropantoate 2-reductase